MNTHTLNSHCSGLPADRLTSVAARRTFFDLKMSFLQALRDVPGIEALRNEVLQAEEPLELWLLQANAFSVLSRMDAEHRQRRQLLRRSLDTVFADATPISAYACL